MACRCALIFISGTYIYLVNLRTYRVAASVLQALTFMWFYKIILNNDFHQLVHMYMCVRACKCAWFVSVCVCSVSALEYVPVCTRHTDTGTLTQTKPPTNEMCSHTQIINVEYMTQNMFACYTGTRNKVTAINWYSIHIMCIHCVCLQWGTVMYSVYGI